MVATAADSAAAAAAAAFAVGSQGNELLASSSSQRWRLRALRAGISEAAPRVRAISPSPALHCYLDCSPLSLTSAPIGCVPILPRATSLARLLCPSRHSRPSPSSSLRVCFAAKTPLLPHMQLLIWRGAIIAQH